MEENSEFINFDNIRGTLNKIDPNLFVSYLKEVFKDLSDRSESNKKKGVSKITFLDYIKLPIFIAEKLFISLDQDNDGYLCSTDFCDGLTKLYFGNFDDTFELIAKMIDFNKDSLIEKGDVKVLFSYLPLKTDKTKIEYKYQMDSLDEIDEIISVTFGNKDKLKYNELKKAIETKKSDIYTQLLCFLYQRRPFNEQNVNTLKVYRRKTVVDDKILLSPPTNKRIPSPSRKSVFSPADSILKLNLLNDDNSPLKKIGKETPEISGYKGMIRMTNQKVVSENKDHDNSEENMDEKIKNAQNILNSPSTFLKKTKKPVNDFSLANNLISMSNITLNEDKNVEDQATYEDYVYKLSESLNLKKYYLVLIGKEIYYYKTNKKEELLGMHNLSGCFVKESGEKKAGDEKLYSFTIQFPGKTRNYYCKEKLGSMKWSSYLKEAIGYLSFFDYYEMLDEIGEGKFGLVKLGLHKKTKERVAIKIIKKESMNSTDIELVKGEIDIMKLCRHPFVVRLLDHFENSEYIFIVMEYLAGGDLGEYLTNIKYKVTEERAANIMYQLGSGIKYLHDYGILHRDLKPENIMLTNKKENSEIKIMDFGLSKIMGPQETVADGFGTLSFVAPEVLIRQPYNRQIDIWSLGIILFHMLSGSLPFDDESDDEEIIAKKIVFEDVQFPSSKWSKMSDDVKDLIKLCLIKDPKQRVKIDVFLLHPWIKKYVKC